MSKRPHIIIFNPDEMRADTLAHLGNPAAVTPNLDHLAATDGVSFRNAYCQNPVCVPSRCSFFTGQYPHVHGHRTMSYLLHPDEPSLLQELREAGYHVWMNDRNDLVAGQFPGLYEQHADEIFYGGDVPPAPGPLHPDQRGTPDGRYYYSHFEGQLQTDDNRRNYSADDEAVDAACRVIQDWREGDAPLCLFLGLFYPHPPYQIEEPYFSAIDRAKLPPRVRAEACTGKAQILDTIRHYQHLQDLSEPEWDELRAVYQGMCMKVDEQFGRLCDALKTANLYDDSAIFFFSDHGDFTGDYGLAEKAQNSFENCLTNVPFLIKPPKGDPLDAGVCDGLVELVDFYATAMDYAGVTPSHTHFGQSLRPLLSDRRIVVRQYAFCEGGRMPGETHCDEYHTANGQTARPNDVYWPKKMAQSSDTAHAKGIMIRDVRYKYISRSLGQDELYDLVSDPCETTNRINDPTLASDVQRLQLAMLKWLQATSDVVPYQFDQRFTEESLWRKVKALVPPEKEQDVRARIRSGIGIGALFHYCAELRRSEG